MDWSSDYSMIAMEEEEEDPVAVVGVRRSIGIRSPPYLTRDYRMMPMEEEVTVVKTWIDELLNLLMERSRSWIRSGGWGWSWSWSRSTREFDKLEARIWKLKTEYHQRKGTELDQVSGIWIDIKKLKEKGHISTEKMQALMSHFRSILGYFAGNGFHPTSPFDHTFRFYCSALLREVAAYSDELIPQNGNPMAMDVPIDIDELGANSFLRTTFGKNISPSDTHISNNNMQTKCKDFTMPLGIGDHTDVLQAEFDPKLSYMEIGGGAGNSGWGVGGLMGGGTSSNISQNRQHIGDNDRKFIGNISTGMPFKNMLLGKMGAETNQTPLLPQKDNRQRELEGLSTFAFLGLILSYAVLYFFYSANLGRKSNDTRVMTGLHVWTVVMMLLMFISSCVRFPARLMIVLRLVMSGILFVSALVVFILLQLAL